jgi:rhamnose utilization protein RhaD (predicted bifunctional aldolase and dehydrogenase)
MKSIPAATSVLEQSEMTALLDLSARIGRDPLLSQASSGNTSLKLNGTLWIKASGKCLANANDENIFVPVDLAACLQSYANGDSRPPFLSESPMSAQADWGLFCPIGISSLRPSIETFMHAVLPYRVVVHVHSVNTISWAVRADAALQLAVRLFGLNWCWIPYADSGFALAREVRLRSRRNPRSNIFVLANHGLVVCADSCKRVETLLHEVERRLSVSPRLVPQPNLSALEPIQRISAWRLPADKTLHTLGTDGNSRRVVQAGVLYPCQAVFLGGILPMLPRSSSGFRFNRQIAAVANSPFLIVERAGVLIREDVSAADLAFFQGYAEIARRIEGTAPLRCLTPAQVKGVLLSSRDAGLAPSGAARAVSVAQL